MTRNPTVFNEKPWDELTFGNFALRFACVYRATRLENSNSLGHSEPK
ncbi:hypothetical protein [Nostoc sp. CHAB 5715]|nr:hypothetical protein [Nostoc sp. CHAB 5715]MCC5621698.1 hypothetical protein [Nostoc sp. CHAB 5715]